MCRWWKRDGETRLLKSWQTRRMRALSWVSRHDRTISRASSKSQKRRKVELDERVKLHFETCGWRDGLPVQSISPKSNSRGGNSPSTDLVGEAVSGIDAVGRSKGLQELEKKAGGDAPSHAYYGRRGRAMTALEKQRHCAAGEKGGRSYGKAHGIEAEESRPCRGRADVFDVINGQRGRETGRWVSGVAGQRDRMAASPMGWAQWPADVRDAAFSKPFLCVSSACPEKLCCTVVLWCICAGAVELQTTQKESSPGWGQSGVSCASLNQGAAGQDTAAHVDGGGGACHFFEPRGIRGNQIFHLRRSSRDQHQTERPARSASTSTQDASAAARATAHLQAKTTTSQTQGLLEVSEVAAATSLDVACQAADSHQQALLLAFSPLLGGAARSEHPHPSSSSCCCSPLRSPGHVVRDRRRRMMRISIRYQLGVLVLLCILVALAVITAATWVNYYNFVLQIRDQRMSLVASLKASELSSSLSMMETSVAALATRFRLQTALHQFLDGNFSADIWDDPRSDFETAFGDLGHYTLAIQGIVWSKNGSMPLLNVTESNSSITLPETFDNGTAVLLGDPGLGYPPALYPNITEAAGSLRYQDQPLYSNSSILLGPMRVNETFAIMSLTLPIMDTNRTSNRGMLGWLTITFNARLAMQYVYSPEGLGDTGTILLLAPDTMNNRFPGDLQYSRFPVTDDPSIADQRMRFVFSPNETKYPVKRHQDAMNNQTFTLSQYPALFQGLAVDQGTVANSGSILSTRNEEDFKVTVGYAIPATTLCTWILVVEMSKAEVWSPIYHLRNVILGCVFGTAVGMLLFVWPLAHLYTAPIRRLREATKRSIAPPSLSPPAPSRQDSPMSMSGVFHHEKAPPVNLNEKKGLLVRLRSWTSQQHKSQDPFADEEAVARGFHIPAKVRDGKHWIHDELTDLTKTFNAMSDELMKQYTELEERVRERTRELEISMKAAEAANDSKTLFIANISHELKTPLNGILGMCAVCMQEEDPEKIKKSLSIIYRSGDLLHNLLTDLLTFSRNEVGRQLALEEKRFALKDVSSQLKAIFDRQASENKIDFSVMFGSSSDGAPSNDYGFPGPERVQDMRLYGDYHRILQVAINLVSNSLKFTPAGGRVNVRIACGLIVARPQLQESRANSSASNHSTSTPSKSRRLPDIFGGKKVQNAAASEKSQISLASGPVESEFERRLSVHASETGSNIDPTPPPADSPLVWLEFEVEDTGPGIPKHLQEDIFKPFVQGDLRLTKKYGGTGLGLSICSQLAILLKGKISLQSEPGKGSKFTLRIPLRLLSDTDATSTTNVSRAGSISDNDQPTQNTEGQPAKEASKDGRRSSSTTFENEKKPRLVGLSQPFFSTGEPPLASPSTPPAGSPDTATEPSRSRKVRVLVAEDNKVNQEVVLRMLRLEDIFDVSLVHDGQEALEAVQASMASPAAEPFDLIFMDVQMPNLDGRQSTRLIRAHGYTAPIVALTAFADDTNRAACMDSGMDAFLAKPIRRPALRQVLRTYCRTIPEEDEPSSPEVEAAEQRDADSGGEGPAQLTLDLNTGADDAASPNGADSVPVSPRQVLPPASETVEATRAVVPAKQ
ncbi:hypothetical protein FH972_025201 [Carpinus fangiana]|uniref:histidine kinase n=1 Tax=Carpinus fangiana TaxID=176857 RepID=A0A5N6L2W9_9ROSI|nr:hypothetical protein FH972_025201 [Carpinus fangiana]